MTSLEPEEPYELVMASSAARAIAENLPEAVAWAAQDFIVGPLMQNPRRVGKPLDNDLAGLHSARIGPEHRIIYRIDDEQCEIEVLRIARRADVYGIGLETLRLRPQLGGALCSGRRGRRFKSRHPGQVVAGKG